MIKKFGKLGLAGALAASLLIQPWEGRRHVPYEDVGGIITVCDGITGPDVIIGKTYTDAECDALLVKHVLIHEMQVNLSLKRRVPELTKAAFISFHYNVGDTQFKRSTLLKLANAGDLRGACEQLSKWVFVKGQFVKGLQNRRLSERTLCLKGLNPSYEPTWAELLAGKVSI